MIINNYINQIRNIQQPVRAHTTIIANTFIDNSPTPLPTSPYEYPKFTIVSGQLLANYDTDNRKLTFNINENGELIATYDEEDPKLMIQDKYLFREV